MKNRNEDLENPSEVGIGKMEPVEPREAEEIKKLDESFENQSSNALERVVEIGRKIEQLGEENPNLKEKITVLQERAKKIGKRIARVAEYTTLSISLLLAADVTDYKLTRYHVDEKTDGGGKIIFQHEDQETTDILNYFSGKADLPPKERVVIEVRQIKRIASDADYPIPENIEDMDENELSKLWDGLQHYVLKQHDLSDDYVDGTLKREIPLRYEFNEKLYKALWKIERESGNPKIRFEDFPQENRVEGGEREFYNSMNNTMHISYPRFEYESSNKHLPETKASVAEEFITEASHGKQFNEDMIKNDLKSIKETVSVLSYMFKNKKSFGVAYDETQYEKPGTSEYEAHKQIEPELKKELDDYEAEKYAKHLEEERHRGWPR